MLPPFRIRNLRRQPSPPGQQRGQSPPKGCYDAIVQITAPQYDLTISTIPEATLKYMDEDQEEITVGSSLELVQRLSEPVARSAERPKPSQAFLEHQAPPVAPYSRFSPSFIPRLGQEPSASRANNLLMSHGINPIYLSETQFRAFQQQNPQVQLKSIQIYAQNVEQHQHAVKAALPMSRTDPTPQSRAKLMQQAKDLVARANQQTEASRFRYNQQQLTATSETDHMHVFDLGSKSQRASNVWCRIQPQVLLVMDKERTEKASKDSRSYSNPSQHGGSLEKSSDRPEAATSDQPENRTEDQTLRLAQDERQYYFEITDPPQLNSGVSTMAANQGAPGFGGQGPAKEPTPLLELDQETNLTTEGRRQAKAAGDKIRARHHPLYKPKDADGSQVPDIYQNRWASYSQGRRPSENAESVTKTPFIPLIAPDAHKPDKSLLEVFEAELARLSSDAQKTKPSEGLDMATMLAAERCEKPESVRMPLACAHCRRRKIRCLGASGDPQGACSNCIRLKKECIFLPLPRLGTAIDLPMPVPCVEPTAPYHKSKSMADPPTSIPFIEPPAPIDDPVPTDDPPTSVPCDEAVLLNNGPAPTIDPGELLMQTIKSLVDGVGSLTTELRSQVSEAQMDGTASSQTVSHALEHGLRSAFKGFASCVQNIAEAVQNASDATQHAADRTRGIDTQILEGAVKGLQGLAGGITAFGRDLVPTETRTVPSRNDAAVSELTAQGRQDAIPSLVTDLPVNLLLPVELVQPSPTMKDGSSAGLVCSGIQRKDEVHEATEGRRYESQRSEQASPVSALSEGLKELSKSGGDRAATEAEKEHQECTACSSLWPDKCYWHESTSLPYKSDTTERGRQSRRSAYRSNPTLTYEYVVPPPAFRAKEHSVLNTQEQDCTLHDSRRSRSRSPPLSSPRRISPTRRSSPSGWPRFHGPGPIHLPQDIPDSIPHRRERRQLWRSRRQHAPRLSDGPLLRRGNDYPAYLSPKPVDFSKAYSHGGDFGSFGSEGRPFQQRTSEQPVRGNLNDGYWLPVGEDRDRPLHQQLRFAPPMYQTRQAGALRHHQSTPTLGRPHGSYEANKQTLKLPVRTHVGRVDIPSGTGWGRSHRRAVARVVPRRYSSVEDVDSLSEDLKSTLDGDSNGPSRRIASEELNVARPDTYSSPVVTHFPTLEQFEGATFTGQPRFPPLPSMEPLIPSRPENRRDDSQESRRGDYEPVVAKATDPTLSKVYPSAWPHPAGEANPTESSGDFFKRMTGLTESSKTRVPLDTAPPEARLMKPFDPLADTRPLDSLNGTAAPTLSPLRGAVRRVNTVAGTGGRYNPSSHRRPYSEFFSGDGRIGWDTFVRGYERGSSSASAGTPEPSSAHPHAQDSEPRPLHPNSAAVDRASEAVFHTHTDPKPAPVKPFTTRARAADTHPDYPAVHKVQQCVDQLTALGFGTEENGGLKRLVVYAQAAEGDLEGAIEMIEEERRAYKERFF